MKNYTVESLQQYAKRLEQLLGACKKRNLAVLRPVNWYRGHGRSNFTLAPGLYRHPAIKDPAGLLSLESRMMTEFTRQGTIHGTHGPAVATGGMAQLFFMQHHGVPTRLLDWTGNPFIALYFALSDARPNELGGYDEPAAVWVLDPYAWNRKALSGLTWGDKGPADSDDQDLRAYHPAPRVLPPGETKHSYPMAVVGVANTPRMFAQKGVFTIFNDDIRPMEEIAVADRFPAGALAKLEVPAPEISNMLQTLISVGYTDSVAFPDLQGLAMEIRRLNGFKK